MEQRLCPLQSLEQKGRLEATLRIGTGGRPRVAHGGLDHLACSSGCRPRLKKGASATVAAGREAFGRSRGGLSTKLHVACDALGNPVRFALTPGQCSDGRMLLPLLDGLTPEVVLADAAYDWNEIRASLEEHGSVAVIKPSRMRTRGPAFDRELYRERNQVERLIGRLKRYRGLGTRYEQTARNYLAFVHVVSTLIWLA